MNSSKQIRVGAVSYLNTKPLIYNFESFAPHADLILDVPSRLADRLKTGDLDVALIPVIEFFQDPSYTIVSDACIGCRGPVYSVKLFSRVPCDQIKTLALDEGSRTSAALTKILLHQRYGIHPEEVKLPIGATLEDSDADAVLLIGDRAMYPQTESFHTVWDLGEEWVEWSKLPFVFAIWVARAGISLEGIDHALMQARDVGVEKIHKIAAAEAGVMNLTEAEVRTYLKEHLYFYLGEQETKGLQLYYQLASDLGLAAKGVEFGYYNCESS